MNSETTSGRAHVPQLSCMKEYEVVTSRQSAIIKLGSTVPSQSTQREDFEGWFLAGVAMRRDNVIIVEPHFTSIVRDNVWRAQFRPEFDVEAVKAYTRAHREELHEGGQDPDALPETCEPSPAGSELLRRFMHLIAEPGDSV